MEAYDLQNSETRTRNYVLSFKQWTNKLFPTNLNNTIDERINRSEKCASIDYCRDHGNVYYKKLKRERGGGGEDLQRNE